MCSEKVHVSQASPDPCSHRCETWWEKWLSCAYSPFLFPGDRQGLLQAVVKTAAAMRLLQWWHQGYNALWFCLSCIFSFCGREVIHYKAKHIHHEKIPKALKQPHSHLRVGAGSKGLSHDICLEDQLTIMCLSGGGQAFAKLKSLGTKLKCYDKIREARPTELKFSIWTQTQGSCSMLALKCWW